MRLEHPDTRAERVVEAITPRLDPEKYPNDGQIKKEDDVRHLASGKCDGNGKSRDAPGRMEKARLRRFDFALLQNQ